MVTMHSVESSNLAEIGYDEDAEVLVIIFKNDRKYRYFHVPEHVYNGLLQADSKGGYFWEHIRGKYPYERVD